MHIPDNHISYLFTLEFLMYKHNAVKFGKHLFWISLRFFDHVTRFYVDQSRTSENIWRVIGLHVTSSFLKSKEPTKLLSSSGMRDEHASSKNRHILLISELCRRVT